jgi:hypothetical protein
MAFQGIVTGFTPNDGQGDTLLAGAIKTNDNFRELYEALGDGTSIGIATLTQLKLSGILTATSLDVPNINLSGILTAATLTAANVQVSGAVTANSFNGDFTGGTVVANSLNLLGPLNINNQVRLTSGGALQNIVSVATTSLNVTGHTNLDNVSIAGVSTFNNNVSLGGTGGVSKVTGLSRLEFTYDSNANIIIGDDITADSIDIDLNKTIENVFIGIGAGENFVQGNGNNFIGFYAGKQYNPSGSDYAYFNNIIGYYAAQKLTSGSYNQGMGEGAINSLTSGDRNIAIGNYAGFAVTTGDHNILLGDTANVTNGSDSYNIVIGKGITVNGNNNLAIGINGEKLITGVKDGSVELYHNNLKKFETTGYGVTVFGTTQTQQLNVSGISTFAGVTVSGVSAFAGVTVSGVSTFSGDVNIPDSTKLNVGTGSDFQFYHDGVDSRIENVTGDIKFKNSGSYYFFDETGTETIASFINDGQVNLFYNNVKRIETTGYGASVFGSLGVGTDPGSHALAVLGDARIIGILTVGESSVTIDGTSNELSVGTGVTLSHSNGIYVGDTRVHSTGFDIGSSSIHSTGATFGTFSVGIFTATVLKSTGIATFQNRIEGPGNFRVKESTGYVGINTVLPQNSLDVRGGVHIGGGDQIIIDGQDIYRQNATLNLRNQQATGGSEVQIRYQHGLSLKGGTDGTGGIELDAGSGFVKSPNGDFVIGSASTTGTDDQKLQVTGGAYVSGAMGIGSVSPERKLDVMGDLKVTENAKVGGIITATSFVGDGSGLTGVIPAASAGIGFKEEGVVVGTATTINFVGVGVTATVSNGVATIDISNDPGEVSIPGISTTGQTNLSEVDISGTVNMGGNLDIVGVTTVQGGLKVSGVTTFNNNVHLPDNTPIQFGTGQDLQIYHNGTNGIIHNSGDGDLYIKGEDIYIQTNDSEASAYFLRNGAVELYYDAVKKFETTGYGITVSGGIFATGIVTAAQFIGDGSGLTGVTAAGSGVEIQNNGSSVGTAATINFASNVTASVTDGVATINATGGGGGGGGGISEGLAIAYAIAL